MNDVGYIDLEFKGSGMETNIKAATAEQLKYRRGYTIGAISYHQKEQNPKQIAFFESALKLIDKRLNHITPARRRTAGRLHHGESIEMPNISVEMVSAGHRHGDGGAAVDKRI